MGTTSEAASSFRVVGYVTDWGVLADPEQIARLTHINYAFALPKPDGTLAGVANGWKLAKYVEMAHAQGSQVLISVGGWGYDKPFEQLAASPATRATFVAEVMNLVDKYDLDGVDIDWEYPDAGASSENFTALMRELRVELDKRGKLLTAAVVALGSNGEGVASEVFDSVDFLNIMVYDGAGPHHSTFQYAEDALRYWTGRGLPQEKRVLGVPFYAKPGDVPYRKLVTADASAAHADQLDYFHTSVTYNGIETIRDKTQLAMESASGVMIWTVTDDTLDATSLLRAIYDVAHGAAPSTHTPIPPLALGAGFRYSTYGPGYDPGPQYWLRVGQEMASRFPGATPQAIWIVSNIAGKGTQLTFPGSSEDLTIHFSLKDRNEEALTLFDRMGVQVWLQVEPGDAPVDKLFHIILERYGHHPSVTGVGVDVEWYYSYYEPEGQPVTDEEARAWRDAARSHNPAYRLFLKHWEMDVMPPTEREGIVFINDSQQFDSLESLVAEFEAWGKRFAPAQVGFQFGYFSDRKWWGQLSDPPGEIGRAILARVPNTAGLYWVDFTAREVFKP